VVFSGYYGFFITTVKPVLRGHLWYKKKWPYKTGDLLKEVDMKFTMTGQEKSDLLIQVTA
jgi:hypothetical protein